MATINYTPGYSPIYVQYTPGISGTISLTEYTFPSPILINPGNQTLYVGGTFTITQTQSHLGPIIWTISSSPSSSLPITGINLTTYTNYTATYTVTQQFTSQPITITATDSSTQTTASITFNLSPTFTQILSGIGNPIGCTYLNGNVYAINSSTNRFVSTNTNVNTTYNTTGTSWGSGPITTDGTQYIYIIKTNTSRLIRYDTLDTNNSTNIRDTALSGFNYELRNIAYYNGVIYGVYHPNPRLLGVRVSDGAIVLNNNFGINGPEWQGIAIDSSGNIYVSSQSGNLVVFTTGNYTSGPQSVSVTGGFSSWSMSIDSVNNILYTADGSFGNDNIYQIVLNTTTTATATTIASNGGGVGGHFIGSVYVNDGYYTNTLFIADFENGGKIYSYHN